MMKVFVAGASGAIGKWLVPMLVERGHEVTGMTRSPAKQDLVRQMGARAVVADALDPEPVAQALAEAEPEGGIPELAAIRHVEETVTRADGIEGIVLRYGGFYGPGTSIAVDRDGEQVKMIRKGRLPIVGDGAGVWSFVHIEDAASATAAAAERGNPGAYNVVDDEPVPVSEFLPELARVIGAKSPRRVPRWLGWLVGGEATVVMMTEFPGALNEEAKPALA